jgi:hypothetical protein
MMNTYELHLSQQNRRRTARSGKFEYYLFRTKARCCPTAYQLVEHPDPTYLCTCGAPSRIEAIEMVSSFDDYNVACAKALELSQEVV